MPILCAALAVLLGTAGAARAAVPDAVLVPKAVPTDRPAHDELTAALRKKTKTLGLDGASAPDGTKTSRALVLLPKDRSRAGVAVFELEGGPNAGVHRCEALGRGVTARTERPGWVRGVIAGTTIYYAPMDVPDGATIPGVYDLRVISPARYEIELFNAPEELEAERDTRSRVACTDGKPKPFYSGVFAHWYSRLNAAMPIDMLWARDAQKGSQGEGRPVFERRPEARSPEAQERQAKQLARNPDYYQGPYGRTGFAIHTDRWEDPGRLADPAYAGSLEFGDFRFRDTEGCVKVRPACLLLLDEFVEEQSGKGRRVQVEVRETPLLDGR